MYFSMKNITILTKNKTPGDVTFMLLSVLVVITFWYSMKEMDVVFYILKYLPIFVSSQEF